MLFEKLIWVIPTDAHKGLPLWASVGITHVISLISIIGPYRRVSTTDSAGVAVRMVSRRTTGATFVPNNSMACNTLL